MRDSPLIYIGAEKEKEERLLAVVDAAGYTAYADALAWRPPVRDRQPRRLWFISLLGNQSSVRVIGASISRKRGEPISVTLPGEGKKQGRTLNCMPDPDAGEWTTRAAKLPLNHGVHAMIHSDPDQDGEREPAFILLSVPGRENCEEAHYRYVNRKVEAPIMAEWRHWLWRRGQANGEIEPMEAFGVQAWLCRPNEEELRKDIAREVSLGILRVKE